MHRPRHHGMRKKRRSLAYQDAAAMRKTLNFSRFLKIKDTFRAKGDSRLDMRIALDNSMCSNDGACLDAHAIADLCRRIDDSRRVNPAPFPEPGSEVAPVPR